MHGIRSPLARIVGYAALWCIATTPAIAQHDPTTCFQSNVTLTLTAFRSDGMTVVDGDVSSCETIKYRVTLSKGSSAPAVCAIRGGQLKLTTPDGVQSIISNTVPCLGGDGDDASGCDPTLDTLQSELIPYTVQPADVTA